MKKNSTFQFHWNYRFVTQGVHDVTGLICRRDGGGAEDVEMGKCMENLHVQAGDSRDSLGRGRFFPFTPENHLVQKYDKSFWYYQYIYYPDQGVSFGFLIFERI